MDIESILRRSDDRKLVVFLGEADPFVACLVMKEVVLRAKDILLTTSVDKQPFNVLRDVSFSLEMAFNGNVEPLLYRFFFNLGLELIKLGREYLGAVCITFFNRYGFKFIDRWPTSRVWMDGNGDKLMALSKDLMFTFDFEADTARDGQCVTS